MTGVSSEQLALDLIADLRRRRIALATEAAAQQAMEGLLRRMVDPALGAVHREYPIPATRLRIDFAVQWPGYLLGIELKVSSGQARAAVLEQVGRYARRGPFDRIAVASNMALALPERMHGVPLDLIDLGRAWL